MKTKRRREIVVIDPALVTPESAACNAILRFFAGLAEHPDFSLSCVQLSLPHLSGTRLRDVVATLDPAGIICLGSYANVTENHEWVTELMADLRPMLFEHRTPFLGICFAHQLLAHMFGCPVGFLRNRERVPQGRHAGSRTSRIVHPKFSFLWSRLDDGDYFRHSTADAAFRAQAMRHLGSVNANVPSEPEGPKFYTAEARHEQEILSITHPDLLLAATSEDCEIDALVHATLPIFTLQNHAEAPHTSGDGLRLLKNFIYFSSLNAEMSDISRTQ